MVARHNGHTERRCKRNLIVSTYFNRVHIDRVGARCLRTGQLPINSHEQNQLNRVYSFQNNNYLQPYDRLLGKG